MDGHNIKSLKSDLLSAHSLIRQTTRVKSVHLPSRMRWLTEMENLPERNTLFRCITRRKRPNGESMSKSKESHLTIDISQVQRSKDSGECPKRENITTCRDNPLQEVNTNLQQPLHQRVESEVQLRKTQICFMVKKSVDKSALYRNRKMSMPMRNGPILPPKTKKKITNENMFIGSLVTHRLDNNHPEISIKRMNSKPLATLSKCQSVMLPSRKKPLPPRVKEVKDFEIRPWMEENSMEDIII